nr:MAG TPA: hypothetical protein [Caudoviricetes sp.]DAU65979.1 MAG TPA: hypothetical protein [Caudoviricetes sp.]DAW18557.1 MAG TPA: hypothetical protein [Caudoviricetes sp.]
MHLNGHFLPYFAPTPLINVHAHSPQNHLCGGH